MTVFTVECIKTEVSGLYGRGLSYVKQVMTAKPEGYQFIPSVKRGFWDGNVCLFQDNKFPSGLLFLATDELQETGIPYQVIDNQPPVNIELDLDLGGYDLRDYQLESVEAALDYKRGILKLATNAGKTLVMAGIIKSTGCNALVVVPSKVLLHQTAEYLTKTLQVQVGRVGDGYEEMDEPVVVTTMASFYKVAAHSSIRPFNTLVIDECHHGKAKSVAEAADFVETPMRIGVSGTPLSYSRLNDLNLMGITGPLLYEYTNTELITAGYSVKPVIQFHEINVPVVPKKLPYHEAYQRCIVTNEFRNQLIADIAHEAKGLTLILVERLEHVVELLELIPNAIPATGASDNVVILEGMKHAKYKTVIATNVFSEGVDAKDIDNIILAGAGASQIRLLQRIGRGLRTRVGKTQVTIHDFIDASNRHLLGQSEARLTTYEREGFDVVLAE